MGDDRGADATTVVIDPDRLATLEEERSFLAATTATLKRQADHAPAMVLRFTYPTNPFCPRLEHWQRSMAHAPRFTIEQYSCQKWRTYTSARGWLGAALKVLTRCRLA